MFYFTASQASTFCALAKKKTTWIFHITQLYGQSGFVIIECTSGEVMRLVYGRDLVPTPGSVQHLPLLYKLFMHKPLRRWTEKIQVTHNYFSCSLKTLLVFFILNPLLFF